MRFYKHCLLHRVIDGDTAIFDIDLGFYVRTHQTIRLKDLDTFELRGGSKLTKELALLEKQKLMELTSHIMCELQVYEQGKYGRWIADILTSQKFVNKEMRLFHKKLENENEV